MSEAVKKKVIQGIRVLLTVGLLVYLVLHVEPGEIIGAVARANPVYILAALLLSAVNLFFQYRKWSLICDYQFGVTSRRAVLSSLFFGISGGMITPMKSGEYIARSLPLPGGKLMELFFATFLDKIIPMIVAIEVGGVLMCVHLIVKVGMDPWLVITTFAVIAVGAVALLALTFKAESRIKNLLLRVRFLEGVHRQLSIIRNYDRTLLLKLLGYSVCLHLTFTSQFALLILAFDPASTFGANLFLTNLVIFIQIMIPPLLIGELGIREGAAVYLSRFYAILPVAALNAALMLFTINFVLPSIYGMFFMIRRGKKE